MYATALQMHTLYRIILINTNLQGQLEQIRFYIVTYFKPNYAVYPINGTYFILPLNLSFDSPVYT